MNQGGAQLVCTVYKMTCKEWLSTHDVEKLYGIKRGTLANWRTRRTGPDYFKIGKIVRYHATELNEYMQEHRVRCFRTEG